MNTQEKARELMVKERKDVQHLEQNLLTLTEQELHEHQSVDTNEKTRELASQKRQHNDLIQDNMLYRAEATLKTL